MQQDENVQLSKTQLAYRTIGQALWNTLCRARSIQKETPECLNRLMDALAESEEKGFTAGCKYTSGLAKELFTE